MADKRTISPFQQWLDDLDMSHGEFRRAAGVCRSLVQGVASGDKPLRGSLREYVKAHRPDVVLAHEAWEKIDAATQDQRVAAPAA